MSQTWWSMESNPRSGACRRTHRGRTHRSGRVVCPASVGLLAVDPGDDCWDGHRLAIGAPLADYGIGRVDLALMGAVTGLGVGVMQALVLAREHVPGAFWWAIANPPGWVLGWFVSSYVIARSIAERFPIFGASGALVFGLLTWLVLAMLLRETPLEGERTPAPTTA